VQGIIYGFQGVKSTNQAKVRRNEALAARIRQEAEATTDAVARQQLQEQASRLGKKAKQDRKKER